MKYVYDSVKPAFERAYISFGLVNASDRKTTSGWSFLMELRHHSQKSRGLVCARKYKIHHIKDQSGQETGKCFSWQDKCHLSHIIESKHNIFQEVKCHLSHIIESFLASWNHWFWSDTWFKTRSAITRIPEACASSRNLWKSSMVPYSGWIE